MNTEQRALMLQVIKASGLILAGAALVVSIVLSIRPDVKPYYVVISNHRSTLTLLQSEKQTANDVTDSGTGSK